MKNFAIVPWLRFDTRLHLLINIHIHRRNKNNSPDGCVCVCVPSLFHVIYDAWVSRGGKSAIRATGPRRCQIICGADNLQVFVCTRGSMLPPDVPLLVFQYPHTRFVYKNIRVPLHSTGAASFFKLSQEKDL